MALLPRFRLQIVTSPTYVSEMSVPPTPVVNYDATDPLK